MFPANFLHGPRCVFGVSYLLRYIILSCKTTIALRSSSSVLFNLRVLFRIHAQVKFVKKSEMEILATRMERTLTHAPTEADKREEKMRQRAEAHARGEKDEEEEHEEDEKRKKMKQVVVDHTVKYAFFLFLFFAFY